MNPSERYYKWVEWSTEDGMYVGRCPDVITGIHGDEPVRPCGELCAVVDDVISHLESEGRPVPPARTRPVKEVA